ncbi:hypothetical protein [Streptococcus pneumoniae]|uniref:hypothetical protein n=1 Tax=Streptococcus pneumoniae TaxID=1313 RepID=UPI00070E5BFF|nr:hypothetical protein [Streptococcus pneumoniae]
MKIKEQTRKLAAGWSKQCFEVVDRTEEVSSSHCFEPVDRTDEVSSKHGKSAQNMASQLKSLLLRLWIELTESVTYIRQGEADVV